MYFSPHQVKETIRHTADILMSRDIIMMSPDLRDAIICIDTCWKKSFCWLEICIICHNALKSFKWSNPLSSQSCQTLICIQVFIAFPIILRRILSLYFILNVPFLYFKIQVALFVGSSFSLFIMLLELMPIWHTLSRSLFLFI